MARGGGGGREELFGGRGSFFVGFYCISGIFYEPFVTSDLG